MRSLKNIDYFKRFYIWEMAKYHLIAVSSQVFFHQCEVPLMFAWTEIGIYAEILLSSSYIFNTDTSSFESDRNHEVL